MKESSAKLLVEEMKAAGIKLVVCLPDSWLKELDALLRADPYFEFVGVTNELEGVSIAAGAWLGGKRAIVVMENSGVRVASEALARISLGLEIPVLMLMSYRGYIGDGNWWAVGHAITMEPMLQVLRIPYCIIDREEGIKGSLQRAVSTMDASKNHVAIIVSGGTIW